MWTLVRFAADWRWSTVAYDTPWYPTMRLFRQTQIRRWDDVFTRMAQELTKLTSDL